ncbi:hypothetical protein ODU07_05365 [Streptococcus suis]|nr:hypothetical protein [Streptococcus suis]
MENKAPNTQQHSSYKISSFLGPIEEKKRRNKGKTKGKTNHLKGMVALTVKIKGYCQHKHCQKCQTQPQQVHLFGFQKAIKA